MARLWALSLAAIVPGAGPMLVLQMAGWWLGFGLIAAALWHMGRRRAGGAVIAIALWPPFLGWQAEILKDGQALAAMLAATGLVAWWRLRGRAMPRGAVASAALLLVYALLVRANAMFAVAPLVAFWVPARRLWQRAGVCVAIVGLTLALSPLVNHRLIGAVPSGVEKTQPLYDLAGIAVRAEAAGTGFTPAEVAALRERRCVTPFFWDPLGDAAGCADVTARMMKRPAGELYRQLALAVAAHPLAYAAQRAAHLNATTRWWVPARWPGAEPPAGSERNALGLAQPAAAAVAWQGLAARLTDLPTGWPIAWIVLAAAALAIGRRRSDPPAVLARALLVSALALEASFAVVSIASDLRYHLWPMIATALALVLLGRAGWMRRRLAATALGLAVVCGVGLAARSTLPLPPPTYAGWMRGSGA